MSTAHFSNPTLQ